MVVVMTSRNKSQRNYFGYNQIGSIPKVILKRRIGFFSYLKRLAISLLPVVFFPSKQLPLRHFQKSQTLGLLCFVFNEASASKKPSEVLVSKKPAPANNIFSVFYIIFCAAKKIMFSPSYQTFITQVTMNITQFLENEMSTNPGGFGAESKTSAQQPYNLMRFRGF